MKKIFTFIIIFFLTFYNAFALDGTISTNKNNISLDDYLELNVNINYGEEKVKEIKINGLNNFKIIGKSQNQTSSTQIVNINGKTKLEVINKLNFVFQLKPIKEGDFKIGPVVIKTGNGEVKTNTLNININGKKITKTNIQNNLNISKKQNLKNNNNSNNIEISNNNNNNNNENYILLIVMIISIIIFYTLNKNINKNESTEIKNTEKYENNKNKKEDLLGLIDENKIEYPDINDKNFLINIEKILKSKLEKKFNIGNINSLTLNEILRKIENKVNSEELSNIKELFDSINKAKYSNIISDYSQILEKVQKI